MRRGTALVLLLLMILAMIVPAAAEETEYYVLCTPSGEVNVRQHARIRSEIVSAVSFGRKLIADGDERNGFIHVVELASESGEGWIAAGYMVKDQPTACDRTAIVRSNARVACRKYIGGKVKKWLRNGDAVRVYAVSNEWCVTEFGYVKTEFLEMENAE